MPENSFPSSVAAFLSARGGESLLSGDLANLAAIVQIFQQARPGLDSDPLSEENRAWLSVLADCIAVTDERIYEHYRALADLFRAGVFRVEDAVSLAEAEERREACLMPLDSLFPDCPALTLNEEQTRRCLCGADFPADAPAGRLRLYSPAGEFLALAENAGDRVRIIKSFFEVRQ